VLRRLSRIPALVGLVAVCLSAGPRAAEAGGFNTLTAQLGSARAGAGRTPIWAGVGAYLLPVADAGDHLRLARKSGAAGKLAVSSHE
jgi:hypothetical protein